MKFRLVKLAALAALALAGCEDKKVAKAPVQQATAKLPAQQTAKAPKDGCRAPPEKASGTFIMTCMALQDPRRLTITVAGTLSDYDAAITSLKFKAGGRPAQSFTLVETRTPRSELGKAVTLTDINFDGFADLQLLTGLGNVNSSYEYWLYDAAAKKFLPADVGVQLSGFEVIFDAKTKTITSTGRSSCCSWEKDTYRWEGARLVQKSHEVIKAE